MNTHGKFVITISREVGSGGRSIGRKLAEKLQVRFLDKQLIEELIRRFNLSAGEIERIKGKKSNWFSEFAAFVKAAPSQETLLGPSPAEYLVTTTEDIFRCEREVLTAFAQEGSCVIAGRSGFFILKDHPNKFDVFIHASRPKRIRRVMEKQQLSEEQAGIVIDAVDASRENFVQRFSGTSRYDVRNYDLVVNVDNMTEEEAAGHILERIEASRKNG